MVIKTGAESYQTGLWAEAFALKALKKKGYVLLEERYKTRYGEVDLIMRDGDSLVFVEVKARAKMDDSLYALTPRMRRRIEQSALHYISQTPEAVDMGMRFDVVAISKGGGISIEHLDNAWTVGA